MSAFERVVVVDWSAASTPKLGADSIWSAVFERGASASLDNHATRRAFELWLESLLLDSKGPTFVGFDFSFGYPAGLAPIISGAPSAGWAETWGSIAAAVHDLPTNATNRFEVATPFNELVSGGPGPFWGCPPAYEGPTLSSRKAPGFPHEALAEYRATELAMRSAGHRVFSGWQLYGAGSVGGQMLLGIALLERLRHGRLHERVAVWPFQTGFAATPWASARDTVVFAEVWPSMVLLDTAAHPVRDAAQVLTLGRYLSDLTDDAWSALFAPTVDEASSAVAIAEEGWILGAGCLGSSRPSPMGTGR